MKSDQTPHDKPSAAEPPEPELLKPKADEEAPVESVSKAGSVSGVKAKVKRLRRGSYRPSHKATFIGVGVVAVILAINAGIIAYLIHSQNVANAKAAEDEVTLSPGVLNSLGVSRNAVGNAGAVLTVGPNANFGGAVTIKGDTSIAGQLRLNSKFSANDASLTVLKAGKTSLQEVNVNGNGTVSNLNVRSALTVAGTTRLQGPVTISRLLTVNNSLNVAGNLAVGGVLSANSFQANNLTSGSNLTIGGHLITRGSAPGVSAGSGLGSNGTVSISGNDASGTVAVNAGAGAGGGTLVHVSFRNNYASTPHVVITPIGRAVPNAYVNRTSAGFNIVVSGSLSPGGYAFDYVVMQ